MHGLILRKLPALSMIGAVGTTHTNFDVSCLSVQGDGNATVFGELFTEICDETPQLHEVLIIVVQNGHNVLLQDRGKCQDGVTLSGSCAQHGLLRLALASRRCYHWGLGNGDIA